MAVEPERLHGFDALRAVAMMLVIVLHAAIPYSDLPLRHLPWAVHDATSRLLSHLFWWLHVFIMPLFFLLGGFFAAQVCATRGHRAFLQQRARRLLRPLLAGSAILLPLTFAVFATGWWLDGACTWNDIRRMKFAPAIQAELFGPAHLWFLVYLVLYSLLMGALRRARIAAAVVRPQSDRGPVSRWSAPWWLLGTAVLVAVDPEIFTAHHNSFLPSPTGLLYHGVFFAAGARLYRTELRFAPGGVACLALALPVALYAESLVRIWPDGAAAIADRLLLAAAVAAAAWLSLCGLLSLCLSTCTRPRAPLRYLADASYWVYLIQLPLVAALQSALARMNGSPLLKCAVVTALTAALCLWSYARWVRHTGIGALLGGRRELGRGDGVPLPPPAPAERRPPRARSAVVGAAVR